MNLTIHVGGMLVIAAVLGIFVFILWQALPLFWGARVQELTTVAVPAQPYAAIGVDEWGGLPTLVGANGDLVQLPLPVENDQVVAGAAVVPTVVHPELPEGMTVTAVTYIQRSQQLAYGTSDGRFVLVNLGYSSDVDATNATRVVSTLKTGTAYPLGRKDVPLIALSYADSESDKLAAGIQKVDGTLEVHASRLKQKKSLMGSGKVVFDKEFDLTPQLKGTPERVLVNQNADHVLVSTHEGKLFVFRLANGEMALRQVLQPFGSQADPRIVSMNFLLGDNTVVLTSAKGDNSLFSFYVAREGEDAGLVGTTNPDEQRHVLGWTGNMAALSGGGTAFAASLRNKGYFLASGKDVSLRYSTTRTVRWEHTMPFEVSQAVITGKYNRLLMLDSESRLHVYSLSDKHPEAGFKAFFGKLWYEGANEPAFQWQSTGGSDDFEPKLSMVPLIWGTLKATLYAMLFAVPVAILAALYTSQFMHPRFKRIVKPTMEIMASLPSVVLGFLGALWLAPLIEDRFPLILCFLILMPTVAMLFGFAWANLPVRFRVWCRPGYEFTVLIPLVLACYFLSYAAAPLVERLCFAVTDPVTGQIVGDFRAWWRAQGGTFEQRNALVVGFMMAFAVIPIIFSIAEDALSNVPQSLVSASLALGASRWQTAMRVVVPTASAGIFSGLMIGLGRAVGETMIVLMCTGNTAIMDVNLFNGMRTLSANIAVELSEAPVHGTLYRTLFLGGFLLFLVTFVLNTLAEVLRNHLRSKYKTV